MRGPQARTEYDRHVRSATLCVTHGAPVVHSVLQKLAGTVLAILRCSRNACARCRDCLGVVTLYRLLYRLVIEVYSKVNFSNKIIAIFGGSQTVAKYYGRMFLSKSSVEKIPNPLLLTYITPGNHLDVTPC